MLTGLPFPQNLREGTETELSEYSHNPEVTIITDILCPTDLLFLCLYRREAATFSWV